MKFFFQVENELIYLAAFDINISRVWDFSFKIAVMSASLFVGYWL